MSKMEQPYVYAQPQPGTGPSAPSLQGSDIARAIVDQRFCAPYPVDITIVRKLMRLKPGNFVITDVNGDMLFRVKDPVFGFHDKRILLDGSASPVLNMREKIVSLHQRWRVFRGVSKEQKDLLYTVKRSSLLQFKTKLDVFLSHNKEEKICDFRVKGSWSESSCVIYVGESDTIVAEMQTNDTLRSVLFGKDNFSVTVYPNVDYAFIASLIVILDDVNRDAAAAASAISRTMIKGIALIKTLTSNSVFLKKLKDPVFGLHDKRILLDGSASPIASLHRSWQVFRGVNKEQKDLLYTVKRSSMIQFKTKLDVFLSHNKKEKRCDFRVKATWSERTCVIYAGESDTIVAQMHKNKTLQSVFLGKEKFSVTVYPNVDYAFIASLIVILDDVNRDAAIAITTASLI
ncbi:unnamed protein product [Thlaspi arvense]|uniref:Protein LURP-one-related 15 n=1 Tax=Thlaspi arvense TaxID=13288 RepID=A0AAU9S0U1_THLAR|nr:unnamed protein product [Thlaspi arvense]